MNALQFRTTTLMALTRKEISRVFFLWRQTILPSVMTTVLYFSIFGVVLGSRVGNIDGSQYIEFVAPGLIMLSVVTNSYANTAFSFFIERFHRSLEELLSAPISDHQIIWGFILGGVFRGLMCAFAVWLTTYAFLGYLMVYPLLFLVACISASLVFSLFGVINGLLASSFDDVNVMTTFLLNPLVMLGGVFYSVNMLPPFWQKIAWLNPVLYVGNLFRFCMIGTSNISPFGVLMTLAVIFLVTYVLALCIMRYTTYVRQ